MVDIPESLLRRSAEAKAKALGLPVEQVLAEMKGEAPPSTPTPPADAAAAPKPQPGASANLEADATAEHQDAAGAADATGAEVEDAATGETVEVGDEPETIEAGEVLYDVSTAYENGVKKFATFTGGDRRIITAFQVSFLEDSEACLADAVAVLSTLRSIPVSQATPAP